MREYIDHTLLSPTASRVAIEQLCQEAIDHQFYAVCVNGCYVSLAKQKLYGKKVKIAAVVGFPLGQMTAKAKVFEAQEAVENGADEIDMVLNIAFLKDRRYEEVTAEIAEIKRAIGEKILKVILENAYLTDEEIKIACQLCLEAGADFVKTSTGFASSGAQVAQVQIMLDTVQGRAQVKAAGGIRDAQQAQAYIEMGVKRLGTSSGIALLKGQETKGY